MTREEAIEIIKEVRFDINTKINGTTRFSQALEIAIKSLEAWDAVKAEIHRMEFIYDKSPLLNDKRTDAQKASDWWGMERLIVLDIIDKHLQEVEE